jgi:16S rRNA (cytidine1402-2'-O)-methyltransferase
MSKLYLIATPIGNLEDITYRAVRILNETDLILSEDTRKTSILLNKYNIRQKLSSFHKFNEHQFLNKIISELKEGKTVALVSDAGTPGISDPGFLLVRECIRENIEVECLPGPTALIPALVLSGIPCDRFAFEGFLPVKKGRNKRLNELTGESRSMIFYESPHRLQKTLAEMAAVFGTDRNAVIARELTKIHEEIIRGTIGSLAEETGKRTIKGEIVIVVQGKSAR